MANNLAAIRKALKLTQPELAERMGTTKNQLIKLEKGGRRLTQTWLEKAAKATGIAIEKFVMEDFQPADLGSPPPEEEQPGDDLLAEYRHILPKLSEGRRKRLLEDLRDSARLEGIEGSSLVSPGVTGKTGQ